jgi:hypothetical protein
MIFTTEAQRTRRNTKLEICMEAFNDKNKFIYFYHE